MVRLTDRPDMTLDVYRGSKTTQQQQQQQLFVFRDSGTKFFPFLESLRVEYSVERFHCAGIQEGRDKSRFRNIDENIWDQLFKASLA